jgi:hypothetical protein
MHPCRKVSPADVRALRGDDVLRANALQMLRLARTILRTVPSSTAHAKRLGISHHAARQIVQRKRYKEVA